MKKLRPLTHAIGLGSLLILAFCLTISNTTVKQDQGEAIKQLSAELAMVKAQMASSNLTDCKTDLSMEPLLAEIALFGGNFAPRNWMFCEGQLLPISSNQALFALLGTMYGGDGRTTFALPDLRSAEQQLQGKGGRGPRYIIAVQGVFPSRS